MASCNRGISQNCDKNFKNLFHTQSLLSGPDRVPMPVKKKKNSSTPGQALVKNVRRSKLSGRRFDDLPSHALPEKSVTEPGNLEDFLAEAELAERAFEAERETKVFQVSETTGTLVALVDEDEEDENSEDDSLLFETKMPRRPQWIEGETSPEELDKMERDSFLEWRRNLAQLETKAKE